jgi:hypothetical protein
MAVSCAQKPVNEGYAALNRGEAARSVILFD